MSLRLPQSRGQTCMVSVFSSYMKKEEDPASEM